MTHSIVKTASLQHLLDSIDVTQLSETKGANGMSARNHYYTCQHARTVKQEGYVPTVFGHESSQAEGKVKAWIAQKTAKGYEVHLQIGHPACTERLSVCWVAIEKLQRGGSICQGCIDMSGKEFMWG